MGLPIPMDEVMDDVIARLEQGGVLRKIALTSS